MKYLVNRQTVILIAAMGLSSAAMADHNSPFGEGWALDPLDMHSDAIESVADRNTDAMEQSREMDMDIDPPTQRDSMDIEDMVMSGMENRDTDAGDDMSRDNSAAYDYINRPDMEDGVDPEATVTVLPLDD